jgi:hypothetical protein
MNVRFVSLFITPCALAFSLMAAPSALAARVTGTAFAVSPFSAGARMMLNGRPVAVLRTANLGLTPMDRADLAVRRLMSFLDPGGRPIDIQPRPLTEGAGVYAGDTLIMVATVEEAEAQHRTPAELADRWARNLRAALTLPPRLSADAPSTRKAVASSRRPPTTDHRRPTTDDRAPSAAAAKARAPQLAPTPEQPDTRSPEPPATPSPTPNAQGSTPRAQAPTPNTQHPTPAVPGPTPNAQAPTPKASPSPLFLSTRELIVPVGESRTVRVVAPGPVTLETVDTATVDADITGSTGASFSLSVRGLEAGKATVRVACGDASTTLTVSVMKYAGQIPATVAAAVTGRSCPASLARSAVRAALQGSVILEPGATCEVGAVMGLEGPLEAGKTGAARVPVRITAAGCLPVERVVAVPVANRILPAQEAKVLLYSNNPESFTAPGSLFLGALERDVPSRLLYHHQNMTGRPICVRVDLINLGDDAVETQVIEGAAGPTWDTVMVGHRATARYVQNSRQDLGTIVTLPPHTRRTIFSERVAEKLAVSGLDGLRLLTPSPRGRVLVEVVADAAPVAPAEVPAEMAERPLSDHVYTHVRKELHARFEVGGNWTFISVGKTPVSNQDNRKRLDGNYGILYDIALELSNPTDDERVVSVSLSPDAGAAMGVFLIDGTLVESPPISPPTEAPLASFRLGPGERRTVPIQTIPVGGSNYPVSLVVRAAAPGTPVAKKLVSRRRN